MNTCLKLFKKIKLPVTESWAKQLRGRFPAKQLHFYSPFCLAYSSASNLFLQYSPVLPLFPAPYLFLPSLIITLLCLDLDLFLLF